MKFAVEKLSSAVAEINALEKEQQGWCHYRNWCCFRKKDTEDSKG